MLKMIQAELFKLRKRRMTWILLIVMLAFFCLTFFATYAVSSNPPERMPSEVISGISNSLRFPDAFETIFATSASIGTLLMIILVGSSIGNEYSWGSVRQVLTRRGIRSQFVIAKLVSLAVAAVIGTLIAIGIGFILAMITSGWLGGTDWSFMTASYIGGLFGKFGWTLYSLLPYILLSAFFTFLGRSVLAGVGGGLGFYFIEAIAVGIFGQSGGWLAEIPDYLIGPNVDALVPSEFSQGPFSSMGAVPSTAHAAIVLAVYCIVFAGISIYLFRKRDLNV